MKTVLAFALVIIMVSAPIQALGSGAGVVVLKEGEPAPFKGFLVPEIRFTQLLQAEIDVADLKFKLDLELKKSAELEKLYLDGVGKLAKPIHWSEGVTFNRWLGFGIGVIVMGLAIYGGAKLQSSLQP